MSVYYVEDDRDIRDLVVYSLKQSGFEAFGFADGAAFREALNNQGIPDLILLDVMLPGEDGVSILSTLKSDPKTMTVPVIMLSARGAEYDRVLGLDTGADDYIVKPFGVMEMIARVHAVLRRCNASPSSMELVLGGICLCHEQHQVTADGVPVSLTLKEYELLRFLIEHADTPFDRNHLLNEIWGYDYYGNSRTVDVHIQTLRQKLGPCGSQIETIRGLGYRIKAGK